MVFLGGGSSINFKESVKVYKSRENLINIKAGRLRKINNRIAGD
ncbi:hypothetical protein [Borreliella burgdorferi]